MKKSKNDNAILQALLDMQDDGSTVDITIGENVNIKNVSVDDNYMEYLMDNINNDSDGMDSTIEYDDMEVEDLYLD
tara:strand:+ start:327 stop:554 length:228 start_codon:yes stop_codon:yes gene_type:complete